MCLWKFLKAVGVQGCISVAQHIPSPLLVVYPHIFQTFSFFCFTLTRIICFNCDNFFGKSFSYSYFSENCFALCFSSIASSILFLFANSNKFMNDVRCQHLLPLPCLTSHVVAFVQLNRLKVKYSSAQEIIMNAK